MATCCNLAVCDETAGNGKRPFTRSGMNGLFVIVEAGRFAVTYRT